MSPTGPHDSSFLAEVTTRLDDRARRQAAGYPYAEATLLYVIDGPSSAGGQEVVVHIMAQRRTRGGSLDRPKPAVLTPDAILLAPGTDRRLLTLLSGAGRRAAPPAAGDPDSPDLAGGTSFRLGPALAAELLPAIARTARAWLKPRPDSPALEPLAWDDGNTWQARLRVDETPGGFRIHGELWRDTAVVPFSEPFLILGESLVAMRGRLARFDADASLPLILELRTRGGHAHIPIGDAPILAEVLATSGAEIDARPAALAVDDLRVTPTPRALAHHLAGRETPTLLTSLEFDYAGTIVPAASKAMTAFDRDRRRIVHRDADAERAAWTRLADLGFLPGWSGSDPAMEIDAARFPGAARRLLDEGWDVRAEGVRYRAPRHVHLAVRSGVDWFDLDARADFGDYDVPLADILAALRRDGPMVRLGDGSLGLLPEEWLERFSPLTSAGERVDGVVRFRRSQAALLDALLADRQHEAEISVDAVFDRARKELATFSQPVALDPPASFTGVLRPYQREGLGWFAFLQRFGFGGCLADDMGLGKTIMVLALLDARRIAAASGEIPRRPSLVVVPRSLVGNWLAEASRFTPALRLVDHSHAQRRVQGVDFDTSDAVLVTYGTLRRDITELATVQFDYVVLDEAQTIKNATTASAKAARLLRAEHRLALSGTPIENHLGELWSLFEFLNPGILGRSSVFQRAAADAATGRETTHLLSRGLRPFILRRTKQQVASELPARTEQTIICELLPKDRRLYENLRRHYRSSILDRVDREGVTKSHLHILEALLRLRQASCHAGLIDPKRAGDESAKFDVLLPQLEEVVAEGHKAIVFSQFTTLLGLLRQRLDAAKVTYEYLDGQTRNRTERVQRFQEDPAVGIFLISLKAGGLGLNLTAAEYVFLLDPWWNPAVEAQAIDRAHRIGQTREVFAYRLIAKDTVEEKVLELQESKRALADAVLSANAVGLRHLSREDLDLLLS